MEPINLGIGLESTHVLVTGGAGMIGSATVSAFLSAGAKVTSFDISESASKRLQEWLMPNFSSFPPAAELHCLLVDISNENEVMNGFYLAEKKFGTVSCCVALASMDLSVLPHHASIIDLPFAQWKRTFDVNVHGTFLTAKTWLTRLKHYEGPALSNVGLIIVGSESGLFGERGNPDYASGKSSVQNGLLQSLKSDVPRIVPGARVNAIAPGPVNTPQFRKECLENPEQYYLDAQGTVALAKPVEVSSVARSIIYLASESWSGSVHGHVLRVDSGKEGKVMWTKEEASTLTLPQ